MTSNRDHLLDDWRDTIRTRVLSNRRETAVARGELAAPLEAFVGDEHELAREVEEGLETMIRNLEHQREEAEEDFLSFENADGEDWITDDCCDFADEDEGVPGR